VPATLDSDDATRRADYAAGLLDGLSQADAIRRAIQAVGAEPRQVIDWLAERGRPGIPTQRVYDVIRRDQGKHARPERPMIRAVAEPVERGENAS
jgi:hypothetical protein